MKTKLLIALCALCSVGVAQGRGHKVAISYNNTSYRPSGYENAKDDNFSLNGFGVGYSYMLGVSRTLPMYVEFGANANFGFGNPIDEKEQGYSFKVKMQDINLQVLVNFGYIFDPAEGFGIAPYAGINFKYHLLTRSKYEEEEDGVKVSGDWISYFDKKEMGDDGTWNRFQMGWQVGVNFFYYNLSLGVQYGTDFIPAYSFKEDGVKEKINTGNLKVTVGFNF